MKTFIKYSAAGIISGLFAFLISFSNLSELIELKSYDLFHYFSPDRETPREIVIVAIDEQSFDYFKKQWPWPRSIHAKLLEILKEKGASVIGMDIVFAENSSEKEDAAFSQALSKAANVVLAAEYEEVDDRQFSLDKIIRPLSAFMDYSCTGIINVPFDADGVVRKLPSVKTGDEAFSAKIAGVYSSRKVILPEGGYISYSGPSRTFKTISYYQAYNSDYFIPKDFFKGKIVLIGMSLQAAPDPTRADLFPTPYLFTGRPLMSGVEIHANIISNILNGRHMNRIGKTGSFIILMIIGLISSFSQIRWKPLRSFFIVSSMILIYAVLSFLIFEFYIYWIPVFAALISLSLPYAGFGVDAYLRSEKRRKEIRKAFSYYVSPKVLDLILSNPAMLKLGGKKEDVTVMFADIANFTPMTEATEPEDLVRILNRFFTEMTKIIFQYNGLVDKFIGDAIMAIWGCPVKDEEHALNATLSAIAMMKRMEEFRTELKAEGYPEIHIRIGLSSGEAIAGNMGSSERFDYTVIGDTVNLSSRLQDANKQLGTSILIDSNVFNRIEGKINNHKEYGNISLLSKGNITVKGKSKEIDVYEVTFSGVK